MDESELDPKYYQLFHYIEKGDLSSLKILLQSVEDINSVYYSKITLLTQAILHNQIEIIKYLLSIGIEVNSFNYDILMTPIQIACYKGNLNIIQLLYSHGANLYHKTVNKYTTLYYAIEGGHLNVVKYLIEDLHYNINETIGKYEGNALFISIDCDQFAIFNILSLLDVKLIFMIIILLHHYFIIVLTLFHLNILNIYY